MFCCDKIELKKKRYNSYGKAPSRTARNLRTQRGQW